MADEEKDNVIEMPTLIESPTANETAAAGVLLSHDALPVVMAKISALESFISVSTRDCGFNDFMREILIIMLRVVKCEAASIIEADHQNKTLFFRAVVGRSSDRVVNFVVPFGQGIVGHVAESRMPLIVDNVPSNDVHLKSIEKAVGFETNNLAAIPIVIRGKIFAVVEFLNRIGEANFTPADVEILTYLCQTAAKVIEMRLMIAWSKKEAA